MPFKPFKSLRRSTFEPSSQDDTSVVTDIEFVYLRRRRSSDAHRPSVQDDKASDNEVTEKKEIQRTCSHDNILNRSSIIGINNSKRKSLTDHERIKRKSQDISDDLSPTGTTPLLNIQPPTNEVISCSESSLLTDSFKSDYSFTDQALLEDLLSYSDDSAVFTDCHTSQDTSVPIGFYKWFRVVERSPSKDETIDRKQFRRSHSEIQSRSYKTADSDLKVKRNTPKSISLNATKRSLFKMVAKKSIKNEPRSKSEEDGGSVWHRRQSDATGGSAPTSPQTANKLPKRPFWKRGSSKQEKGSLENFHDSLNERDSSNSSSPIPSLCYGSPAHHTLESAAESDANTELSLNQDEILRKMNSLKIWIQEAKDIPDKRGYYCSLLINDRIEHRTTSKYKDGLCFWGEHFEINHLPEKLKVGLRLEREDKNKTIGMAEFTPEPSVKEPRLDQWIYLNQERSSKDKETPAIRYRYYFQNVTILPLAEYSSFIKYLTNSSLILCRKLEAHLDVKGKEDVVKSLISVLQHHGKAVSFLAQLIISDVEEKGGSDEIIFRGNSMATKAIEAYMKLMSKNYLNKTLRKVINDIISGGDFEVDPTKIPNAQESMDMAERQKEFQNVIQEIWNHIIKSAKYFPVHLREVFYAVKERIKRPELTDHLISACVFLRLLCPAILSPYLFHLTREYPEQSAIRRLTLVAKTLQTLANFTTFQSKETCMQFMNEFIDREQSICRKFIEEISRSGPPLTEQCQEVEKIDDGKHLALLHLHLKHSLSTLDTQIMDSELRRLVRQVDHISDCLERHKVLQYQERLKQISNHPYVPIKREGVAAEVLTDHNSPGGTLARLLSPYMKSEKSSNNRNPPQSNIYDSPLRSRDKLQTSHSLDPTHNRIPAPDLSTSHTYVLQSAIQYGRTCDANDNPVDNNLINSNATPVKECNTEDYYLQTQSKYQHKTVEKSKSA